MLPKPPPRDGALGFLYLPPYRVQGVSVAGEATSVQVPEIDVTFDLGVCPRAMLASKYVAITHGHMDHVGGLAYWVSQRRFQGMGTGTVICDKRIEGAVRRVLESYHELEQQKTPFELIALEPEQEVEVKNNLFLRGFHTEHTSPSMGYTLVERRSKLKEEFTDFPQEKLKELKQRGVEITRTLRIPLIAFTGDTAPGPHLLREDVRDARIIITECTFFEPDHRSRAKIGMHLHVSDIAEWLHVSTCEAMVLTHVSRRTHMGYARKRVHEVLGQELSSRVHFLMDHRTNRERYEQQVVEAENSGA